MDMLVTECVSWTSKDSSAFTVLVAKTREKPVNEMSFHLKNSPDIGEINLSISATAGTTDNGRHKCVI